MSKQTRTKIPAGVSKVVNTVTGENHKVNNAVTGELESVNRETGWYSNISTHLDKSNPDNWDINFYDGEDWQELDMQIPDSKFCVGRYIHPTPVNPVPADGWISCKDKLPDMGAVVLAIDIYKRRYEFPVAMYRTAHPETVFKWYSANNDDIFYWQVTHWMEIQEPRMAKEGV